MENGLLLVSESRAKLAMGLKGRKHSPLFCVCGKLDLVEKFSLLPDLGGDKS